MKEVKVGIIGVGIQGETQLKAFRTIPNCKVIAVCDSDITKAKTVREKYKVSKIYHDYNSLIEDKEVDLISVCTPDFMHYEFVMASLKAGKHTLVEKPMATSSKEAEEMVNEAKRKDVYLMVNFSNRWSPPFRIAKESIEKEEIGEIVHAYSRLSDTIFVPTEMIKWSSKTNVLWFLGSHVVDLLLWYFEEEVKEVYGKSIKKVLVSRGINTVDSFHAILQFRKGSVAVMENSWILPPGEPFIVDFKMDLIGEKGAIKIDRSHHGMLKKITDKYETPDILKNVDEDTVTFVRDGLKAFINSILEEKNPPITGEDGLKVTRVIEAMMESSSRGVPIRP